MIYLELSDRAGDKTIELDGCFSISELIDLISERLSESDEEDSDEESDESEESIEDQIRNMKAETSWLDLGRDVD
jgi:hypothetical protein